MIIISEQLICINPDFLSSGYSTKCPLIMAGHTANIHLREFVNGKHESFNSLTHKVEMKW